MRVGATASDSPSDVEPKPDRLTQLTDADLVERGLAARNDNERRKVEYEMWRRQNFLSRKAILIAEETGRAGEVVARFALGFALGAIVLSLIFAFIADHDSNHRVWYLVLAGITVAAAVFNLLTTWVILRERLQARTRLQEFDKMHDGEATM